MHLCPNELAALTAAPMPGWARLALLVLAAVASSAGQDQPLPAPHPHAVPHCDIPARAERTDAHPCRCTGMVAEIQEYYRVDCWRRYAGFVPPAEFSTMLFAPAAVKSCLLTSIPDHCLVIAEGFGKWNRMVDGLSSRWRHETAGEAYNACATSCKPESCRCPDRVCGSHSQRDYHAEMEGLE